MQDLTLLIMAAGMGSRYGGLKQIEPIGPNGEFLIDYSIYDALQAGFTKVVFVIKKENEDVFRKTIGNRVEKHIKVEYVFQDIKDVPASCQVPVGREKPWGTAQAVLCAKDVIKEPFAIINADDFYGKESYKVASSFLKQNTKENTYCIVGYKVKNTLSLYGAVKRAVLREEKGYLKELIECNIEKRDNQIIASPLNGEKIFSVDSDSLVSMNLFGFKPTIFAYLEKGFLDFLKKKSLHSLTCEYLIPEALYNATLEKEAFVKILSTDATWYGVTYKEDKKLVVESIGKLIEKGEYPQNLWLDSNSLNRDV